MATIADIRKAWGPDYADMPDAEIVQYYASASGVSPQAMASALGTKFSQSGGLLGDTGRAIAQGAVQLPAGLMAAAELPITAVTGYRPLSQAGDALSDLTGINPTRYARQLEAEKSQAYQEGHREIDAAWKSQDTGAWDVTKAYLSNPRNILDMVAQSAPGIGAGGVISRGARLAGLTPGVALGAGEGTIMAGQQLAEYDPNLPNQQRAALMSGATGLAGGAIGAGSGRLARRMGLEDVDVSLAGQAAQGGVSNLAIRPLSAGRRIGGGVVMEGGEEAAQGVVEQSMANLMRDLPITQEMPRHVIEGMLAGNVMGGAMNLRTGYSVADWQHVVEKKIADVVNPDLPWQERADAVRFLEQAKASSTNTSVEAADWRSSQIDALQKEYTSKLLAAGDPLDILSPDQIHSEQSANFLTPSPQGDTVVQEAPFQEHTGFEQRTASPQMPLFPAEAPAPDLGDPAAMARYKQSKGMLLSPSERGALIVAQTPVANTPSPLVDASGMPFAPTQGVPSAAQATEAPVQTLPEKTLTSQPLQGVTNASGQSVSEKVVVGKDRKRKDSVPTGQGSSVQTAAKGEAVRSAEANENNQSKDAGVTPEDARLTALEAKLKTLEQAPLPKRAAGVAIQGKTVVDDATAVRVANSLVQRGKSPSGRFSELFQSLRNWDYYRRKLTGAKSAAKQAEFSSKLRESVTSDEGVVRMLHTLEQEFGTAGVDKIIGELKKHGERAGVSEPSAHVRLAAAWMGYKTGELTGTEGGGMSSDRETRGNFLEQAIDKRVTESEGKVDAKLQTSLEKGVLSFLADNSWQRFSASDQAVSHMLHGFFRRIGASVPKVVFDKSLKSNGEYSEATNTVTLNPDTATVSTVLHELIHGAVATYIRTHPKSAAVTYLSDTLKLLQKKASAKHIASLSLPKELRGKIEDILARSAGKITSDPVTALNEFVAYGLTDSDFQQFMRTIPLGEGKSVSNAAPLTLDNDNLVGGAKGARTRLSLWSRFTNAMSWILSNKALDGKGATLLDQFLSDTSWLVRETVVPPAAANPATYKHGEPVSFTAVHESKKAMSDLSKYADDMAASNTGNNGLIGFGAYVTTAERRAGDPGYGPKKNQVPVALNKPFVVSAESVSSLLKQVQGSSTLALSAKELAAVDMAMKTKNYDRAMQVIMRGLADGNARNVRMTEFLQSEKYDGVMVVAPSGVITEAVVFSNSPSRQTLTLKEDLPVRAAVANGGVVPPSVLGPVDYKGDAPTQAWLEPVFRTALPWLYGKDPKAMKWLEDSASATAQSVRENSPKLARFINKLYAPFNISPEISAVVQGFKSDRHAPVTAATQLSTWLKRASKEEVLEAFAYMDDPKAATKLSEGVRQRVDGAREAITTAVERSSESVRMQFEGLSPSEMLTRAVSAATLGSKGLGINEKKLLLGQTISHPTAAVISGSSTSGKFYAKTSMGPDGKPKVDIMFSVKELPKDTTGIDLDSPYAVVGLDKKATKESGEPMLSFRRLTTAKQLINDPKLGAEAADTIATSFLNTVSLLSNSIATRNMAQQIAEVGGKQGTVFADKAALLAHLGQGDATITQIGKQETRSAAVSDALREPGNWVQLPNQPTWGDLKGKIVEGPIYAALQDAINRDPIVHSQLYNRMVTGFKKVKTVYSPATIATNVMSNFTLAYMHNLSMPTVMKSLKLYAQYMGHSKSLSTTDLKIMTDFHASGATLGNWSTAEVGQMLYESMAANMENKNKPGYIGQLASWYGYENSKTKAAIEYAKKKGVSVDEALSEFYSAGDNMFRLAAFTSKMGELQRSKPDMTHEAMVKEAGAFAKEAFLDYDIDARYVQALRQTLIPFISWPYAFAGVFAKIIKNQPWKLATLAIVYSMVSAALSAGDEDEDEKRRRREHLDDKTWFGANKQMYLGEKDGKHVYFDAARWFMPTPMAFQEQPNGFMGIKSWPAALTPSNPFLTTLMAALGFDPYTGAKIHKDTDTAYDKFVTSAIKAGVQFTPPWASERVLPKKPGSLGNEADQTLHYTRVFLAPVSQVDEAESRNNTEAEINRVTRGFDMEISRMKKNAKLGRIDRETMDEAISSLKDRKTERLTELKGNL